MSKHSSCAGCCLFMLLLGLHATVSWSQQPSVATGRVFLDANANGTRDTGEKPLAGIRVSNGKQIVTTDAAGRYQLAVGDDTTIFVIKPRGYRTRLSPHNTPLFYYTHKPAGSPPARYPGVAPTGDLPPSIDFGLIPQSEPDQFQAILFGDPQPRNQQEVDYIAHDVVEDLLGTQASLGVTLGDIVFDNLDMFEPQARVIGMLGIPWYNVVGNHDLNFDSPDDLHSDETFERHFGPNYYSFDYGPVHFVVLDDVLWYVPEDGQGTYRGGLGPDQLAFIRRDLELIPAHQWVVLMMHIPLVDVEDRHALYRLIEQRPFCLSISAHRHTHEHRYITTADGWRGPQPHHHVVNVTVSGNWWGGAPDERGIPHTTMRDGAPNGYSIIAFDGKEYNLTFHAAGRGADYQLEIMLPEAIPQNQLPQTPVYVNVFNADEHADVRFRVNQSRWQPMQLCREVDPLYRSVYQDELQILEKYARQRETDKSVPWRKLVEPALSTHLWKATLPTGLRGLCMLEVRAPTMDGKLRTDCRLFRVDPPVVSQQATK